MNSCYDHTNIEINAGKLAQMDRDKLVTLIKPTSREHQPWSWVAREPYCVVCVYTHNISGTCGHLFSHTSFFTWIIFEDNDVAPAHLEEESTAHLLVFSISVSSCLSISFTLSRHLLAAGWSSSRLQPRQSHLHQVFSALGVSLDPAGWGPLDLRRRLTQHLWWPCLLDFTLSFPLSLILLLFGCFSPRQLRSASTLLDHAIFFVLCVFFVVLGLLVLPFQGPVAVAQVSKRAVLGLAGCETS